MNPGTCCPSSSLRQVSPPAPLLSHIPHSPGTLTLTPPDIARRLGMAGKSIRVCEDSTRSHLFLASDARAHANTGLRRTHIHAHMHTAYAHTGKHFARTHTPCTHTHLAHTHTQTYTHHTPTQTHLAHNHTHTHTHTRARAHTHTHTHTQRHYWQIAFTCVYSAFSHPLSHPKSFFP